jgi:hypothetical protein
MEKKRLNPNILIVIGAMLVLGIFWAITYFNGHKPTNTQNNSNTAIIVPNKTHSDNKPSQKILFPTDGNITRYYMLSNNKPVCDYKQQITGYKKLVVTGDDMPQHTCVNGLTLTPMYSNTKEQDISTYSYIYRDKSQLPFYDITDNDINTIVNNAKKTVSGFPQEQCSDSACGNGANVSYKNIHRSIRGQSLKSALKLNEPACKKSDGCDRYEFNKSGAIKKFSNWKLKNLVPFNVSNNNMGIVFSVENLYYLGIKKTYTANAVKKNNIWTVDENSVSKYTAEPSNFDKYIDL